MITQPKKPLAVLVLLLITLSYSYTQDTAPDGDAFVYTPERNLKDITDYHTGMIVSANRLASTSESAQKFKETLLKDFTSITAENDMKMANIFMGPDSYDFSDGDQIIAFAKANNLRVHGHTLLWHRSIPNWLQNYEGTDEQFTKLIESYVKAVVSHFAKEKTTINGQQVSVVASWDVANEVIDDDTEMRETLFLERMGRDYVSKLFTWAREADPNVKLFYNDYNVAGKPDKRKAIFEMINAFIENGIPIDGIGYQVHINYDWPSKETLEEAVSQAVNSGLLIHFSELDVKVNFDNDIQSLTKERAELQEQKFREVAAAYNAIPREQQFGITLWGMRDNDSWLYDGGTEWPLMYTHEYKCKIAHRGFAEGLSEGM